MEPHRGSDEDTKRLLGRGAALLLLLALLTGAYVAAAATGRLAVDPRVALASHMNALMGTFLLAALGWTLPMLRYGAVGRRRLAMAFVASSYANWGLTAIKAALGVRGIDLQGHLPNDAMFVLLQLTVVVPSFVASVAWIVGFGRRADAAATAS